MKYQKVDKDRFRFTYLPPFAGWILKDHLAEFGRRNLQLSKDLKLPLLQPFLVYPDEQLLQLGLENNRLLLSHLEKNDIGSFIEQSLKNWADNNLGVVQKDEIVAEDLGLAFSIRRRLFQSFIFEYTKDPALLTALFQELESYTTTEELLTWSLYIAMQQEKISLANEQLEFNQELLLEAQSLGDMGSFLVNFDDRSKSVYTPQYHKILNLKPDSTFDEFLEGVEPSDRDALRATLDGVRQDGGEFEFEYRYNAGGQEKRIWTRGIAISRNGKVQLLKGTIRDITKKQELLRKLKQSETLHKEAQALTHLGHWSWPINSEYVQWSDELYNIFGIRDHGESITVERFVSLVHPDDRDRLVKYLASLSEGKFAEEIVYKIITADKGPVKVVKTISKADFDSKGRVVRTYGTCQDVTKENRLNQELLAMNASLGQKNRELELLNEELESFNYVASHDLQEPLRKIQIYSNRLLEGKGDLSEQAQESLAKVLSAAERMQNLITDLIEFSQVSSSAESFEEVDLNEVLAEVGNTLSEMIRESGTELVVERLPAVRAIPFHMTQLFTNLVNNAIKYRKPGEAPRVKVSARQADGSEVGRPPDRRYLAVSVQDNGIGFDPAQKDNIFELFKRLHTREKYAGTGIGLAICKKIMQHHDGFIRATGEPGQGATFTIYLPHR